MTLVVTALAVPDYAAAPGARAQPSADITITGIPFSLTNTTTVWRTWDGQRAEVRGARDVPVLGTTEVFTDYECPFGVWVAYQVTVSAVTGDAIESAQSTTITLDVEEPWISDPFSPQVACAVRLSRDSLTSMEYERQGGALQVTGSALPVGVLGIRHEAAGIPFRVLARDRLEATEAATVLRYSDPFVLRCPKAFPVTPLMYLTAGTVAVKHIVLANGEWQTSVSADSTMVTAPTANAVINTRTYADLPLEASTYADLISTRDDYLAVLRGAN